MGGGGPGTRTRCSGVLPFKKNLYRKKTRQKSGAWGNNHLGNVIRQVRTASSGKKALRQEQKNQWENVGGG